MPKNNEKPKSGFRQRAGVLTCVFLAGAGGYLYDKAQGHYQEKYDYILKQSDEYALHIEHKARYDTWILDARDYEDLAGQGHTAYTLSKQFMLSISTCTQDGAQVETRMQIEKAAEFSYPSYTTQEGFPFAVEIPFPEKLKQEAAKRSYRLDVIGRNERNLMAMASFYHGKTMDYFNQENFSYDDMETIIMDTLSTSDKQYKESTKLLKFSVIFRSGEPQECMLKHKQQPIGGPTRIG